MIHPDFFYGPSLFSARRLFAVGMGVVLLWGCVGHTGSEQPDVGNKAEYSHSATSREDTIASADILLMELGCKACHSTFPGQNLALEHAPNLSFAGRKYQPSYLFHYLQSPQKIRQHIGHSRMPDFGLSKRESLALTKYLIEQKTDFETGLFQSIDADPSLAAEIDGAMDTDVLLTACEPCHAYRGRGSLVVSDLSNVGSRLKFAWIRDFLVMPSSYISGKSSMPAFFYKVNPDQATFEEVMPDAAARIHQLTEELVSAGEKERKKMERAYDSFRKENEDITVAMGRGIYQALQCGGCHAGSDDGVLPANEGLDLIFESKRIQKKWLTTYLKNPHPIRPFGHPPGTGSRMPDFHLSEKEVSVLVQYVDSLGASAMGEASSDGLSQLTPFQMKKTERLFRERYSCIGCHRLGDKGGRIGPDLGHVKDRLMPSFVNEMIQNPHKTVAGSVMPPSPISAEARESLVRFLFQYDAPVRPFAYPDLTRFTPVPGGVQGRSGKELYSQLCSSCHGVKGDGDGFNALFLTAVPTIHSDSAAMSVRPDDTLFDGIFAGGYILNKSHEMPEWGASLS
ncbi:MAG: c-type cytochrome, partial [Cyclobacteriaceae bacterium]|nr:c-type cytochrome [Cyclobacteriaceae bacterium]